MITIITPTYNRAYCLEKLYVSLISQDNKNFEWLIIDDGSADHTEALVNEWIKASPKFDLRYIKQLNGGKHRAINTGVGLAKGDYVFIVDSDDFLTKDAIHKVIYWTSEIDHDCSFAGVSGTRGRNNHSIIGGFPEGSVYIDATNIQRPKLGLLGDKAEVYRTSILRKYPFPEFEGEKFLPESVVWDEIAHDGYKIRWYRDVIYVCEYLDDGLTRNSEKYIKNNFRGYTEAKKKAFHYYPSPTKWGALLSYMGNARMIGIGGNTIREKMDITLFEYMIGCMLYGGWKLRKNIRERRKNT